MRALVLIVAAGLAVAHKSSGQTISELDKKNGYKEFSIGSELSAVQKELHFLKVLKKAESKLYEVKENVVIEGLAGKTELVFYKDRLVEITVFFKQTTLDDFNQLRKSLEQLYGPGMDESDSKNKPSDLTAFDKIIMWKGAVIGLQLNYDVSDKVTEMIYWGLNEVTEKTKEEF
jgi:hypothetical protein